MKSILISDELHNQLKSYCNENQLVIKLVVEKMIKDKTTPLVLENNQQTTPLVSEQHLLDDYMSKKNIK